MPIFEYYCEMCGKTTEAFEKIGSNIEALHCEYCAENGKDSLAFKKISKSNFKVNGYNATNGYARKS